MLKDYRKLLCEEHHDGESFCIVVACVEERKLQIHREDYGEWEMNRRTGTVECNFYLDEDNTEKLCRLLGVNTSAQLISALLKNVTAEAESLTQAISVDSVKTTESSMIIGFGIKLFLPSHKFTEICIVTIVLMPKQRKGQ